MTTLFVPSVRKKNGTGHVKRCLLLAEALKREGEEVFFYLDVPTEEGEILKMQFPPLNDYPLFIRAQNLPEGLDRIILDNRQTSYEEFTRWESLAPVILLDEGGEARSFGSFLIDTLPNLERQKPNITGSPLFSSGSRPVRQEREKPALLISFGGEDPAGLTLPVLNQILKREGLFSEIAVVRGPIAPQISLPEGVTLYESLSSLEPLWEKYDILITSFGLTPYEAERAGCGVVLVNPGSYHNRLARRGGFFCLGSGSKGVRLLGRRLKRIAAGERKTVKPVSSESVPDILKRLSTDSKAVCPLCGQEKNRAVMRFPDRTFYYCRSCRNYYLVNWRNEAEVYDREYFFSRYKAQYGKTYLEDFENIKQVSFDRLNHMEILLNENRGTPPKLVDLGCAFGPFLAAARDRGFDCRGVEINADGARWIEENLSIPVIRGSLEDKQVYDLIAREPADGATLWYVIEHLPGQRELLTQLNLILRPGGMLAFGTPSGKGISARRNLRAFLENSPADHFVIYTPEGVHRILPRFGFSSITVKSVGHHPERFAGWVGQKGSFTYNAMMAVSRLFSLGDSLEAYALKNESKEPSQ